jgi:phospholipid/cholesterol/gamma-HCH transport system ATP-binding protein
VAALDVARGDRVVLAGLDAGAAEMFVHLVTGAALPDEGDVRVAGRSTREIATDTEWLASLDRFGLVTERAVLLESLAVAANLALPLTLAIESMAPEIERRVEALAAEVDLPAARLSGKASALSRVETTRLHLARALAVDPLMLLLERPTVRLGPGEASDFGATLRRVAEARGLGWIALTDDAAFSREAGGTRLRLDARTGRLKREGLWRRLVPNTSH